MSNLLSNAAEWFKARETRIDSWYSDDQGRYAFRVSVDDQPMIVTAKKYLNDGDASFFAEKVVQRARDRNALILLFVFQSGQRLLFDPATVQEAGEEAVGDDSRRKRGETWIDVDADIACDFRRWYDGTASPASVKDVKEKPHDITAWGDD